MDETLIPKARLKWLNLILRERFGYELFLEANKDGLILRLPEAEGGILFDRLLPSFSTSSTKLEHISWWNAKNDGWHSVLDSTIPLPGLDTLPTPLIEKKNENYIVHYDIPGLTYWMLSRVEEVDAPADVLDHHGRFPATASHAYKYKYLDRPVVDEWLHILGQVIQRQWPVLKLKRSESRTLVSCDVDSPFFLSISLFPFVRKIAGDVLKRRSLYQAWKNVKGSWQILRYGDYGLDQHRSNIDWIMDENERVGQKVAFYFIPESTDPVRDNRFNLDCPLMRKLLRDIHIRGHEIGIHPGYNTYRYPDAFQQSVVTFRRVLEEEGISQTVTGGRQHYLRWKTPTTANLYNNNGLDYDTTLSYAERPGFRCGTCYEYPMFDPVNQKSLSLRQRPLIVMECSVIAEPYMGLGYSEEALRIMQNYRDICYKVGGNFTLLWHNSHLNKIEDKVFYKELIKN